MVDTQDLEYVTISGTTGYVSTSNTYTTAIPAWSTTAQPMTIKINQPWTATVYNPDINIEKLKEYVEGKKIVKKEDKLDPRLVKVNKEIEELRKKTKFYFIKEYVPEKVYGFTFKNDKNHEYKTICSEEDPFDLTFAFALAYAKQDAGKILTINGIIQRAHDYFDFKQQTKEFKNAIKLFNKLQEKEILEKQIQYEKKRRHDKLVAKKIAKKKEKKQEQYEIIKSAIKDSKYEL